MSRSRNQCQIVSNDGRLDLIEEMRLRTWARLNYTEPKNRVCTWPSVVHDEMEQVDSELESGNLA